MPQFTEHPLRQALEMEAHARPPVAITAPARISHLAAASGEGRGGEELEHLNRLCSHFKATPPGRDATQADIDLGPFRLKWERHTEFATYTFICEGAFQAPFKEPVIADVPEDWLAELPGEIVHAFHFAIEADDGEARSPDAIAALFDNNAVLAGDATDGAQGAVTGMSTRIFRVGLRKSSKVDMSTEPGRRRTRHVGPMPLLSR